MKIKSKIFLPLILIMCSVVGTFNLATAATPISSSGLKPYTLALSWCSLIGGHYTYRNTCNHFGQCERVIDACVKP